MVTTVQYSECVRGQYVAKLGRLISIRLYCSYSILQYVRTFVYLPDQPWSSLRPSPLEMHYMLIAARSCHVQVSEDWLLSNRGDRRIYLQHVIDTYRWSHIFTFFSWSHHHDLPVFLVPCRLSPEIRSKYRYRVLRYYVNMVDAKSACFAHWPDHNPWVPVTQIPMYLGHWTDTWTHLQQEVWMCILYWFRVRQTTGHALSESCLLTVGLDSRLKTINSCSHMTSMPPIIESRFWSNRALGVHVA